MEKKKRYCPSCGAKTNDAVCEICGRHTKAISERYHEKNLYILEDDVASDEERQYTIDQKEKVKKTKENAASFEREAKHPNYEYKAFQHPNFVKPKFEHPKMAFEKANRKAKGHIYKEQENMRTANFLKSFVGVFIFIILLIIFLAVTVMHSIEEDQEDNALQSNYETLTIETGYFIAI